MTTRIANGRVPSPALAASMSAVELKADMRKLWEDHITYTRNFVISALGDPKSFMMAQAFSNTAIPSPSTGPA
jgi:hypothetical protein